jgi:hypothetical protein
LRRSNALLMRVIYPKDSNVQENLSQIPAPKNL